MLDIDTRVQPGDVVCIHVDGKPSFYARVEEIRYDLKPGWRQIRLMVLAEDRVELTWILEPNQIDGDEFTMGGTPVRLERLPDPVPTPDDEGGPGKPKAFPEKPDDKTDTGPAEVISFPGGKEEER